MNDPAEYKSLPLPPDVADSVLKVRRQLKSALTDNDRRLCEFERKLPVDAGKMLRPSLLLLFARLGGAISPDHICFSAVVELIHTASLLHDDVIDSGDTRRGLPSFNSVFGTRNAILMGDLLVSRAFLLAESVKTGFPLLRVLFDAMSKMSSSELLQELNRGNFDITEADYIEIAAGKTSSLFAASCRLGALSWADESLLADIEHFAVNFGITYQMINDYQDIYASPQSSASNDLLRGCFTIPVIHCLSSPARKSLIGAIENNDILDAMEIVNMTGSLNHSVSRIEHYKSKSLQSLSRILSGDKLDDIMLYINKALEIPVGS
jgi:geranylgeranyl pyrophosphate synthase